VALIGASTGHASLIAGLVVAGLGLGVMHVCINMIAQVFAGPLAAGKWVGVQNGIGNLAGITNPIITGAIIDATGSYAWAFALAASGPLISAFSLAVLVPRVAPIDWAAQR
jgi:nitrate/nitrite transporter NarK